MTAREILLLMMSGRYMKHLKFFPGEESLCEKFINFEKKSPHRLSEINREK